jgi:hypothetical protein
LRSKEDKAELAKFLPLKMQKKMRFYVDENVPSQAVATLKEMGSNVRTVQESSKRGHPDENVLAEALCACGGGDGCGNGGASVCEKRRDS